MELIEASAFGLMIVYLIASFVMIGYNAYIELVFRLRRKISYSTYKYFEPFFMLKVNYYNIGLLAAVLGYSILLFGLFIGSNVVRIYCLAFIPIDIIIGWFLYYEFTRFKYNNEDIVSFDSYYRDLHRIEKSKTQLLTKINKIESDFISLSNDVLKNFGEYNAILPNAEKEKELNSYIDACKAEFAQNREELTNYNKSVISQFDASLNEYLTKGISTDYEIPEFRAIDIQQMFDYVSTLRHSYESYVCDNTKQKLAQGAVKNADKIITVLGIAIKASVSFEDSDIVKILEAINQKVSKKETVVLYMLSQNLISENVLFNDVIKNDWAWCLTEDNIFTKNRKKVFELYNNIVLNNSINCCNKMLNMNTYDQSDILVRVLNTSSKSNACTQIIKFRVIIQSNDQQFDNPANMYENMAVSIRNYVIANPEDENRAWIIDVCRNNTFYENREQIASIYTRISQKLKDKYGYLNNVLICFYEGRLANDKYIDNAKITNFYLENILTLNNQSLKVFALIACAIILIEDGNEQNVSIAANGAKQDQIGRDAFAEAQTTVDAGKLIIKNLLKTKMDKVIPIVNRVEVQRMSLDKLRELSR